MRGVPYTTFTGGLDSGESSLSVLMSTSVLAGEGVCSTTSIKSGERLRRFTEMAFMSLSSVGSFVCFRFRPDRFPYVLEM